MRRFFFRVALVAAASACVPSTADNTGPRGAAGARLVPTAIAQGTPFVTSDGWTITFERIALVALVSTLDGDNIGTGRLLVWDGARETQTYVPSIPVGTITVNIEPEGVVRDTGYAGSAGDPDVQAALAASALAPEVQALVVGAPDNPVAPSAYLSMYELPQEGPAVIFAAVATKEGRSVRVALALASAYQAFTSSPTDLTGVQSVDVQANDVRFASYEIHPERIFAATADEAALLFEPIAQADQNLDGIVTADELRSTLLPTAPDAAADDAGTIIDASDAPSCSASGVAVFACVTMLDRIADNAQHVFVSVGPP